jgi:hypothetical protein
MASAASSSKQLLLLISTWFLLSCLTLTQETSNSVVAASPAFSFSFNFTNESSYENGDLLFEGGATQHGNLIDLTCNSVEEVTEQCPGRMSYIKKVPFHDDTTLASFSTSFTFRFEAVGTNTTPGDGMAFFLSGNPSNMPLDYLSGDISASAIVPHPMVQPSSSPSSSTRTKTTGIP